jgi:hypothetical protein
VLGTCGGLNIHSLNERRENIGYFGKESPTKNELEPRKCGCWQARVVAMELFAVNSQTRSPGDSPHFPPPSVQVDGHSDWFWVDEG